jgi:hypothetical protein
VSQRTVRMERDLWIVLQSVSPQQAAALIADKREAINDPQFQAIYLDHDAAFDWSPDDPRLYALADRSRRWLTERHRSGDGQKPDPVIAELLAGSAGASSPAWQRLSEIAGEPPANP